MKTIWKYPLEEKGQQVLLTTRGQVLSIIKQYDIPVMYILASSEDIENNRHMNVEVLMVGTGHGRDDISDSFRFINTLSFLNDRLIFHFFVREIYG